jgi:ribosomal protein S18 acetylase RimI-like enzyme
VPAFRSRGIGSALLRIALKESERRGIDHVAVYSSSREWQRLIRFYDSFGLEVWYIQFFK